MRKLGLDLQIGDVLRNIHGRKNFQILNFAVTDVPGARLALNNWGEGVYLMRYNKYEVNDV